MAIPRQKSKLLPVFCVFIEFVSLIFLCKKPVIFKNIKIIAVVIVVYKRMVFVSGGKYG